MKPELVVQATGRVEVELIVAGPLYKLLERMEAEAQTVTAGSANIEAANTLQRLTAQLRVAIEDATRLAQPSTPRLVE